MTVHVVQQQDTHEHKSFRLTRSAPRQVSTVLPDVVLPADRARVLLTAARDADVSRGGALSAGPAGIQLWSGPWDAPDGRAGTAEHLGSVDWSWDTPSTHYVTVYRVLVTLAGAARGLTAERLLQRLLELDGRPSQAVAAPPALPLPRDPFKSESWNALTGSTLRA